MAKRKKEAAEQSEAFKEKAREIGADKAVDLDAVMKRLAGQKRSAGPKKEKRDE